MWSALMLRVLPGLVAAVFVAFLAGNALAADISRLEWGAFVVETDSSNGWDAWKSTASDDGRSVKLTFSALEAKADGATKEASFTLSGHYDISQPADDDYTMSQVTLEGHVIKSSEALTRIVLTIGSVEKIVEWPAGLPASEKFNRVVDVMLPGNGRLPDPFYVGIQAYAQKGGDSGAAYVSIDALTVTADNPKVAQR
jgi:hypothetical protein